MPSNPDFSSRKGGLLSIDADIVLLNAEVGYVLTYADKQIAEVTHKQERQVEVKDKYNKNWLINLEQLKGVDYFAFTEDLANAINQSQCRLKPEQTAREHLAKMSIGDQLCYENEVLATLVKITQPTPEHGTTLTFEAANHSRHVVSLNAIPPDQSVSDYLQSFEFYLEQADYSEVDSLLIRYFREEFFDKMLVQMADDHRRNGDTWLSRYANGVESYINQRFEEYFNIFNETSKPVPWLKIAGYAILAQAREDHPEWLL